MNNIEEISISELSFDPSNVRRHSNRNIDAIKDSLNAFGQQRPILVDRRGVVLAGNGTMAAAKALGWKTIRVLRSELEGAEAIAYAIADNRTAELAEWDQEGLLRQLNALQIESEDLFNASGFEMSDLDALISDLDERLDDAEVFQEDDQNGIEEDWDQSPDIVQAETTKGEVIEIGSQTVVCADCIETISQLPDNSVDSICTDPPYGIGFMGKGWDCSVPGSDFAEQAFRVLKPGGHIVAFAATRTVHRLTVALEDAGFEIRDLISWLQWQGFPKSTDISKAFDASVGAERKVVGKEANFGASKAKDGKVAFGDYAGQWDITEPASDLAKQWNGWGTALKPAQEPAILARKPLEGTLVDNFSKWGVGGLNIDATRIPFGDPAWPGPQGHEDLDAKQRQQSTPNINLRSVRPGQVWDMFKENGRWPANIYYCPKPSRNEKEEGCDDLQGMSGADAVSRKEGSAGMNNPRAGAGRTASHVANHHPTVKPVNLMRWLLRLITPKGGKVLEPFAGSGTTLVAAQLEGFSCYGIEREPSYCDIIRARVKHAVGDHDV